MAVFPGKDAKPKSQSSRSADTERTEKKKVFSSVNSISALRELCDPKKRRTAIENSEESEKSAPCPRGMIMFEKIISQGHFEKYILIAEARKGGKTGFMT
jgi:hypothetical protein